jgi:predicted small metal-binding protein
MQMVINCECGWTVKGSDTDEVVDSADKHLRENHPDVVEGLTREAILAMAEEEPTPTG